MDKFDAMQLFVRIVEKGSFSAIARERGIGHLEKTFALCSQFNPKPK